MTDSSLVAPESTALDPEEEAVRFGQRLASALETTRASPLVDALIEVRPPNPALMEYARQCLRTDWHREPPPWLPPFWQSTREQVDDAHARLTALLGLYDEVARLWAHNPALGRTSLLLHGLLQTGGRDHMKRLVRLSAQQVRAVRRMARSMRAGSPEAAANLRQLRLSLCGYARSVLPHPFYALATEVLRGGLGLEEALVRAVDAGAGMRWGEALGAPHGFVRTLVEDFGEKKLAVTAALLEMRSARVHAPPPAFRQRAELFGHVAAIAAPEAEVAAAGLQDFQVLVEQVERDPAQVNEAARLLGRLALLHLAADDLEKGIELQRRSLDRAVAGGDVLAQSNRTAQLVRTLLGADRHAEALPVARWAVRLARGEPWKLVDRLGLQAQALAGLGRLRRAAVVYEHAARIAQENGLVKEWAHTIDHRCELHLWAGEYEAALERLRPVADALRGTSDGLMLARILNSMGVAANHAYRCAEAREHLEEALRLYSLYGAEPRKFAMAITNLAAVRSYEEDYAGTISLLEPLFKHPQIGGYVRQDGAIYAAHAYMQLGRHSDALELLEGTEFEGDTSDGRLSILEQGWIYHELDREDLAIRAAERFIGLAGEAEARFLPEAYWTLGVARHALGRDGEAEESFARGHAQARRFGPIVLTGYCDRWARWLLAREAGIERAAALMEEALAQAPLAPSRRADLLTTQARLELKAGRPAAAAELLAQAISLARDDDLPGLLMLQARAQLRSDGDWRATLRRAAERFDAAEPLAAGGTSEHLLDPRSSFAWGALDLAVDGGDARLGMNVALMAKSAAFRIRRALADEVRVSGRTELVARLLRMEERASILRNGRERMLRAGPAIGLSPDERDAALDRRLDEVVREIAALRARYEEEGGRRLRLPPVLDGDPLALLEALSAAHPDVLFVELYVTPERTCAALARGGRAAVEVVGPGQGELTANVLARAVEGPGRYLPTTGLLQNFADLDREPSLAHFLAVDAEIQRVSAYLTEMLGGVLAPWLAEGCRRLALMPHGPLASLPLHALVRADGVLLLDRVDVTYAPNAFALALQMQDPPQPGERLAVAGGGDLPFASLEARLFVSLAGAQPLRGDPQEVLQRSRHASWLHFATHGSVDHLLPLDSGVTLPEGRVTVDDVLYRMSLVPGATVSLTACEGSAPSFDPDDDQFGLTSAFLVAGAGTVLAPLWPVDDLASLLLMVQFLSSLEGAADLCAAWNEAQRWVRDMTVEELERDWTPRLTRYLPDLPPEALGRYAAHALEGRPFGWPVHWASFHCTGGWHPPAGRLTSKGGSPA